jgi:hypothetical protein
MAGTASESGTTGASGSAALPSLAASGTVAVPFTTTGTMGLAAPGVAGTGTTGPYTATGSVQAGTLGMAGTASMPTGPITTSGSAGLATPGMAGTENPPVAPASVSFTAVPGLAQPGAFTPGQPGGTNITGTGSIGLAALQLRKPTAQGSGPLLAFPF